MLSNYVPTMPCGDGGSEKYRAGWIYADWYLRQGGSPDANSPDGWSEEKYEGWWDRLAAEKRTALTQ